MTLTPLALHSNCAIYNLGNNVNILSNKQGELCGEEVIRM